MEKIKKKVNELLDNKILLISVLIAFILFGAFIKVEYSRCTYKMYYNPWEVEYEHFKTLGRYFLSIGWKIVSILRFSLYNTYRLSYIMAMFFIIFSLYKMEKIAEKFINNKFISMVISCLIIVNPFVIDLFIYLEKGFLVLSLFTTICAIEKTLKYFDTRKKSNLLYSILFLMISAYTYQGLATLFIAISLVTILKYSKNIIGFIKNNIIVASVFGVAMGTNYLCIKLFNTSVRIAGEKSIIGNLKVVADTLDNMIIHTYNTMPKYIFLIIFFSLFIIYLISLVTNKKKFKEKMFIVFGFIYIFIGTFIISLFPQLTLVTASVLLVPRSTFSYGAIIGIFMMFAFNKIEIKNILKIVCIIIFIVYFFIEIFWMQKIIIDHYTTNYLDNLTGKLIGESIEDYEKENGVEVKYVVYYEDANLTYSYPDMVAFGQMNQKVVSMYSKLLLLNYISGNNLVERHEKNMEYEEKFKQKDWDYFNEEQLIFDGDTVHICQF